MLFKRLQTIQRENQVKYGQIKAVNFTIVLLKKWLKDNDIEIYLTHNKGKPIVAEDFLEL